MEGIAALSLILFVSLYRRLIKPYHILLNGMELLNEQDFSNRLRLVGNDEANRLIEIFNRMMTELKNERLQVRETNRFLDLLIRASPQGVVILDFDERISEINPAGLRLLKINDIETVKGKKIGESDFKLDVYKRQVWIPYTASPGYERSYYDVMLLARNTADFPKIREEVNEAKRKLDFEKSPKFVDFAGPRDHRALATVSARGTTSEQISDYARKTRRRTVFLFRCV